ncbi:unnamed protein product [Cochlearia groenlandica]
MNKQIFYQFVVVMIMLTSSEIKGCIDSGIQVLRVCGDSIDKKLPSPPTPSQGCCNVLQIIGMPCVCQVINNIIESVIDMQKLVNVASACGRPLVPGSQCGTYRVPSA